MPPPPYPQPTGSTTHHLATLIHPQSYNTHILKGPPTLNVNILLPSEPVYFKLVPNLNIEQRKVYQSNQRVMLIYCHPVNLCTISWYRT